MSWLKLFYEHTLEFWIRVWQGPTALAVGAAGVVWTFFSLIYHFSFLSSSLWETAKYRQKAVAQYNQPFLTSRNTIFTSEEMDPVL